MVVVAPYLPQCSKNRVFKSVVLRRDGERLQENDIQKEAVQDIEKTRQLI